MLGAYGTTESRQEYAKIIGEWEVANHFVNKAARSGRVPNNPGDKIPPDLTINELLAAYLRHCEAYYVKDGKPTSEQREFKLAMAAVKELMIGVELRDATGSPAAALLDTLFEEMKDAGFLLGKTGPGRNVLTLMPPLEVTSEVDPKNWTAE